MNTPYNTPYPDLPIPLLIVWGLVNVWAVGTLIDSSAGAKKKKAAKVIIQIWFILGFIGILDILIR